MNFCCSKYGMFGFALLAALAGLLWMQDAAANPGFLATNTASTVCAFYGIIHGKITHAIATASIAFLGISSFFGKVNWGTSLIVFASIGAAYGGLELATMFTGHQTHSGQCYVPSGPAPGVPALNECNSAAHLVGCAPETPCPRLDLAEEGESCEVCFVGMLAGERCIKVD